MDKKRSKFFEILDRNFSDTDTFWFGINKKFYNQKHDNKFARDFEISKRTKKTIKKEVQLLRDKYDLYICYVPIEGEKKKENAKDSFLIVQDIDGVPIPEDMPPSYYWETSPNKYQGVWILDNKVTPEEYEILARKLIAKYGFDPCGVDVTHFYRIPNSYNHKYATPFKVSPIMGNGKVYRKSKFVKDLKDVDIESYVKVIDEEIPLKRYNLDNLIEKYDVARLYNQVLATDRSEWAWSIEAEMIKKGASKEEVKFMLLNAPDKMAKFNRDNVDKEVNRAFAKISKGEELHITPKNKKTLSSVKKNGKNQVGKIPFVKVGDIEPFDNTDFWLIEDFWQNKSVGIIGAPSKSFKSTLTLNLACAVALGRDFDGHKTKQGNVLIIQGENNLSLEQQKIFAITGETDIPIYFIEDNLTIDKIMKIKQSIIDYEIKLLIIDPLYLLFGSGDINKHQDITQRLELLSELRNDTDVSIMLVHHSRKLERGAKIQTSDMYGSAFIEGWYESMILLQRSGNNSSRMVTYFRNHKSGDVYNLVVNDNMGCRVYKEKDENAYGDSKEVSLGILSENEE